MSNPQPTLADLINDRKGDRSYERLSRDAGGTPTRNRIYGLTKPLTVFPEPETLRGIARALSIPMSEVVLAAARSTGLAVPPTDPTVLTIAGAGNLPPELKETLLSMARQMIRTEEMLTEAEADDGDGPRESPAA